MAIKICINPSCGKENVPERIHCGFCGWKLPPARSEPPAPPPTPPSPPSPPTPVVETQPPLPPVVEPPAPHVPVAATTAPLSTLLPLPALLIPPNPTPPGPAVVDKAAEQHQALKTVHEELTATHQKLVEEHGTLAAKFRQVEQSAMKVPGLQGAVDAAKAELGVAKTEIERLRAQVGKGGQTGGGLSLPAKAAIGIIPVLTLIGGMFAGIHTPLNTFKAQNDRTRTQLGETAAQLDALTAQRKQALQADRAAEAKNNELSSQVAQQSSQLAQQTQTTQAGAAQLASAQREVAALRASLAKSSADLAQAQRQQSATELKVAQATAESNRRATELAAAQSVLARHPLLNYNGPKEGNVTFFYTAKNDRSNITVDHQHYSGDSGVMITSMNGSMLPGIPVIVQAGKGASIAESPSAGNGWARVTLRVEGKGPHQASFRWSVPQ